PHWAHGVLSRAVKQFPFQTHRLRNPSRHLSRSSPALALLNWHQCPASSGPTCEVHEMFDRFGGLQLRLVLAIAVAITGSAVRARAADQVYFSSNTNVTDILVRYINQETVRLDISNWYLSEHSISLAILQ